jgi:hypothetical protein
MGKIFNLVILCACLFSGRTMAQNVVMTWVSPYYVNDAKTVLENSYGDISVKSALTRVGLQFWNIRSDGTVDLMTADNQVSDAGVHWFADWGKQNNIKILLTVVNDGTIETGYPGFDWTLVRQACYGTRGDTLMNNLLAEVDKYNLDGIDLDFEGEDVQGGPFTRDDNIKYSIFVNNLCDSLHARGKLCTIDSYSGNDWGAPRPDWWSSWRDKIDAIHTMGYTSTYWNSPTDLSYQGQQDLAIKEGIEPQKLLPGLPMWVNNWAGSDNNTGTSNKENLNFILNCLQYQTGITLWDIHAPAGLIVGTNIHPWIADTVWRLIKAIHDGQVSDLSHCPANPAPEKLIDDMSNLGINLKGGTWSAFSDNWSRTEADQANSTRVLTPDRSFDMALQYGTYGDVIPGYVYDAATGQELKSIIKTFGKAGANEAEGGFLMNLMPVDRSLDSTAEAWEISKIGVERDLSAYKKMVVCALCTSGKKIRIYLVTKTQLAGYAAGFGSYFTCSGNYEDYELPFASLKPIWGGGPAGFDAAHTLRLTIEYVDPAPPSELILNIAGVAADTSVLGIKHRIPTHAEYNKANQSFYEVRSDGIYFTSAAETTVSLYSLEGRLFFSSSSKREQLIWGSSFSPGIYFVLIQRGNNICSEKVLISKQ